jgi:flagellar protein FliJ
LNRFRFRFESVLRLRDLIEEGKEREFGVAAGKLKREEDVLYRIANEIDEHKTKTENDSKGFINVRKLILDNNYSKHLEIKKTEQKKAVTKAVGFLEKKRLELVESTKQKKVMERLKEKDREEYIKSSDRLEQAAIDDSAAQRFNNKKD